MLLAIFSADSSLLRLFVPWCNSIASVDSSSKHPITRCFIAFVVAPDIEWTETMDFILRLNLQPSKFLIVESPRIKVSFTALLLNFDFLFFPVFSFSSFFLSVSLLFSFAKSEELSLWYSFSVEILVLLIFLLFSSDILDSLFGCSFCKNTGAASWFFFQ